MCNIFGIGLLNKHKLKNISVLQGLVTSCMTENVIGGRTASGLSINSAKEFAVLKRPMPSTDLIKTEEYSDFIGKNLDVDHTISILGHCRFKTKGSELYNTNNHPIVRDDAIGVHNGVITNDDGLFKTWAKVMKRNGQVDSEAIFALIDYFSTRGGAANIHQAIARASRLLDGSFACAMVHRHNPYSVWIFRRKSPQTILLYKKYGIIMWSTSRSSIINAVRNVDLGDPTEVEIKVDSGVGLDFFSRRIHKFSIDTYLSGTSHY